MNDELQYPDFDDKGKVVCQICGKSFQVISPRHLALHKIQYSDYTKRYPSASLSCEQFVIKSKYGKHTDLFVKDEDIKDDVLDEEVIVDEEPELEELELETALKKVIEETRDPVQVQKMRVLDHLKLHFANIEKDYSVRHISPLSKKQIFYYITDFCDPVLRIIIQFPNTFWHNIDTYIDPLKNIRLKEHNWKVIEVKGKNPSPKDIDRALDSM